MHKTHKVRTTFGSWDVEKVHAVLARSTFRSQNVQNTPSPDHFWKLWCRKSARRCGAEHISKSKCTKHLSFGPLLEVEMSKKCTPLWREAHLQVKMYKTPGVRTTFGSWDVKKVHAVVARSTGSDHFWKLRCRKSARRFGAKHISKSKCTKHTRSGPLLEVVMSKKCTPLWREAHFQVKMYKTPQLRTTFGSWDVEKVRPDVARSTFPSQNVQNTSASDHFWKLWCRKSAPRCGAKHISKSKCTKHTKSGPLLEVVMSKKCTPLWRESHFQVKMYKTPQLRTTFGSCDVEKVRAIVARSTFRSQHVKNTRGSDHFWRCGCWKSTRRCGVKMYKTVGVRTTFGGSDVASLQGTTLHNYTPLHSTTLNYTTLHYNYNYTTTVHYTKLHYTTLHSTPLHYSTLTCTTLHYTTLHYTTLHYTTFHYNYNYTTTLHYTKLHYTTLHYITLHYTPLHYTTLHYTTLPSTTLHYITLHSTPPHYNYNYTTTQLHNYTTTLHYTKLHYTTLHYIRLHYIPLHSTTLHYTTLHWMTLHHR